MKIDPDDTGFRFAQLAPIFRGYSEFTVWCAVDETAAEELRQIKSGKKDRIALERIEEDYLLHNEDSGMIPLFQQILKEAKDRKFESSSGHKHL